MRNKEEPAAISRVVWWKRENICLSLASGYFLCFGALLSRRRSVRIRRGKRSGLTYTFCEPVCMQSSAKSCSRIGKHKATLPSAKVFPFFYLLFSLSSTEQFFFFLSYSEPEYNNKQANKCAWHWNVIKSLKFKWYLRESMVQDQMDRFLQGWILFSNHIWKKHMIFILLNISIYDYSPFSPWHPCMH